MTDVLVITRRELAERRMVLIAAAAFAAIAVTVPFYPGVHGNAREIIAMSSLVLASWFTLGLAAILGGTFVGREIAAGRISFYYARPVSALAIWFGKLLAAIVLIIVSFGIVILPALAAGIRSIHNIWGTTNLPAIAIFLGAAAALFIIAHASGTMIRSRSALIALDFFALVATVVAGWEIFWATAQGGAIGAAIVLAWIGGIGIVVAFVAAGAWQLADGRIDRRRSHAAFSKVFWGAVAGVLAIAAAFTIFVVTPSPADLQSPMFGEVRGAHALVSGVAKHRFDFRPLFLIDVPTGKVERLGGGSGWQAELSRDGSRITGIERNALTDPIGEMYVRDARPGAPWVDLHAKAGVFDPLAATDDGSRVAVVRDDTVAVWDVARKASLGSAKVGRGTWWVYFATPDLLRMYSIDGMPRDAQRTLRASEFDLRTRALRRTGGLALGRNFSGVRANADGTRLLLTTRGGSMLCDARTLQVLANLPASRGGIFLRDGRIVMTDGDALTIADAGGAPTKRIPVGTVHAYPVEEVAPGTIVVAVWDRDLVHRRIIVVDASRGVVRSEALMMPMSGAPGFTADPRPPVGSQALLAVDSNSAKLVRWNPLTGEKTALD